MPERYAILVDAGYLFAQGSSCLTGQKQPRHLLRLDIPAVIDALITFATGKTTASLLRIYWYDAASGSPSSAEQNQLAYQDNVKVRLGTLNNQGQQKGVDSLIVTDLVTLAQNRAITDAILLTGDEDIRVGVQLAQPHGVRVHLLGIHPARGSQSNLLRQEVDTCSVWGAQDISRFLEISEDADVQQQSGMLDAAMLDDAIHHVLNSFDSEDLQQFQMEIRSSNMLPGAFDGRLLQHISRRLKNEEPLNSKEKRIVRTQTRAILLAMRWQDEDEA